MLLDFIRLRYVVTIEKDNDSSRHKLIVFWGKQKPNNILYSITFGESPMEMYEYCWYEKVSKKDNKKIIRLIRSADGLLRPNVFNETGSLDSTLPPVILDGYGRLTKWNHRTGNVLTITEAYDYNTYTIEHNIATQSHQNNTYRRIVTNNSGFQMFCSNSMYNFKRGHIDEVEYFDMSRPDNTKETGIQNICRIYIHKDRDDICKGRTFGMVIA